jgi:hypothetical protein
MIDQSETMEILVTSCPSFRGEWNAHCSEWGNDVLYVAAGAFAEHLLAMYASGASSSFPAVAESIERLCNEGAPWVKEFVTVGVLEGIQNVWANAGTDPESFGRYLMPESRARWESLNTFWSGKVANASAAG